MAWIDRERDYILGLRGYRRTIYDLVYEAGEHGIKPADLESAVYKYGGPLWSRGALHVHVHHLNRMLKYFGLRVYIKKKRYFLGDIDA